MRTRLSADADEATFGEERNRRCALRRNERLRESASTGERGMVWMAVVALVFLPIALAACVHAGLWTTFGTPVIRDAMAASLRTEVHGWTIDPDVAGARAINLAPGDLRVSPGMTEVIADIAVEVTPLHEQYVGAARVLLRQWGVLGSSDVLPGFRSLSDPETYGSYFSRREPERD